MKRFFKFFMWAMAGTFFLVACSSDDETSTTDDDGGGPSLGDYQYGYFVLNEGKYNEGNATVSFVGDNGVIHHNIFETVNGSSLGDVAQHVDFNEDYAYIVLNGSNTIEVVNRYTFESVGSVNSGLNNPRYIEFYEGKAYVSNWGDPLSGADDYIAIINLETNAVVGTISVAEGPEKMDIGGSKLFVAHKGGWSHGNTVSVINLSNNTVETTLEVRDVPDSIQVEGDFLYVLCSGKPIWTGEATPGALLKIKLSDYEFDSSIPFEPTWDPINLVVSGGNIYFTLGVEVYKKSLGSPVAPALLFSATEQGVDAIYGFNVRANMIYLTDAKDYNSNGSLLIYSSSGMLLHQHTMGLIPNGIYFHN
ncbi:MAG TPA: DUF5074 domain-containing protein [Flavobacteriaceae bacterium]|nr:DUF5074 domain-containing protein [Flavobacteriaceae bacterium]